MQTAHLLFLGGVPLLGAQQLVLVLDLVTDVLCALALPQALQISRAVLTPTLSGIRPIELAI